MNFNEIDKKLFFVAFFPLSFFFGSIIWEIMAMLFDKQSIKEALIVVASAAIGGLSAAGAMYLLIKLRFFKRILKIEN